LRHLAQISKRSKPRIRVDQSHPVPPPSRTQLTPDRLITAKDHASIQITVADVDAEGKAIKGQGSTIALCGKVRQQGEADDVSAAGAGGTTPPRLTPPHGAR
jgi:hypothetical protein